MRELGGGEDGIVRNHFHTAVGEGNCLLTGITDVNFVKRVLEPHDAHTDRAVLEIRIPCFGGRIKIDVDNIIQHTDRRRDRLLNQWLIQFAVLDVCDKVYGTQVANRRLIARGVQQNFGTKVGTVDHAAMTLG